ncbi:MAG: outer membrane protein assembly factor [Chromatiales bacterium]|nr:outer membrane protein assembly factor [Chromatiales bacterium]
MPGLKPLLRRGMVLALLMAPAALPAAVEITGLSRNLERLVLSAIRLDEEPCSSPEWRVRRLYREAIDDIREVLSVRGFYDVEIERSLRFEPGCWQARFHVMPGEAVLLREISVGVSGEAGQDSVFQGILGRNPLQPGAALDHEIYESYKRRFSDAATQRGYFDGRFTANRIDVYPEEGAADILLQYDSGARYVFGDITWEQEVVSERLIRRFQNFEAGTPYNAARIGDLFAALFETGYFDVVDIRSDPDSERLEVPVRVILTPAPARNWTAGLGYGTDTGPLLLSRYLNRRRNLQGHQLELSASLSPVISETGAVYRLPLNDPRAEWLSFSAGYKIEQPDNIRSELVELGARAVVRRPRGWLETRFIDFRYEDFRIGTDAGVSRLLTPGVNWVHKTAGAPLRPQRAHRVSFQVSGTGEFLGSSSQYLQTEAFGRIIRPLWRGARVLARAEAGFTAKDEFRSLPFSVRFFAGGDYSVRGYDYKTLGPVDENGDVIGGSYKLVTSIEIDQLVSQNWAVAAFVDSGNAFDDFDRIRLKTGAGAGVRWISPIGPVRLDVGFPLSSSARDNWRIHVTLGPDL